MTHLALLGVFELSDQGERLPLPTKKLAVLLAYLAVQGPRNRAELATLLWPERSEEAARRNLRQELFRLKSLGLEIVEQVGDSLRLAAVETDIDNFQQAYGKGQWQLALSQIRGSFCQGLEVSGSQLVDDWLASQRQSWFRRFTDAHRHWAAELEQQGQPAAALEHYLRVLEHDPLIESVQQRVLHLYSTLGQALAGLKHFEAYQQQLAQHWQLEPAPETQALAAALARGELLAQDTLAAALPEQMPLIGRDQALGTLRRLRQGKGLCLLVGEAGVGKTRVAEQHLATTTQSLQIKQYESLDRVGFYGVREALAQARQAGPWPDSLPQHFLQAATAFVEGKQSQSTSQAHTFEALSQLIVALSRQAEGLFWDDLQWLDAPSLEFLPYLVRRVAAQHRSFVAAVRPEALEGSHPLRAVLSDLQREGLVQILDLALLSERDCVALIQALAGVEEVGPLARHLYQATAGNPYFLEESLRYLVETGVVLMTEAGWSTVNSQELPLPPTIREAILSRLHRWGEEAVALAQLIALADNKLTSDILFELSRLDVRSVLSALEGLRQARLVKEQGGYLSLHHAIARQAILAELSPLAARHSHHRLATIFARRGEEPGLIAQHFDYAGQPLQALPYYLQAMREAEAQSLLQSQIGYASKILDIAQASGADQQEALLSRTRALVALTKWVEAEQDIATLLDLAQQHSDQRLELRTLCFQAEAWLYSGHYQAGAALANRALGLALTLADSNAQGQMHFLLAWYEHRCGSHERQWIALQAAFSAYQQSNNQHGLGRVSLSLMHYHLSLGQVAESQAAFEQSQQLAKTTGHLVLSYRLEAFEARQALQRGDFEQALALAEALHQRAEAAGELGAQMDAFELMAMTAAALGLAARVRSAAKAYHDLAQSLASPRDEALAQYHLAQALLIEQHYDEARQCLEAVESRQVAIVDQAQLAHTQMSLAELDVLQQRYPQAVDKLQLVVTHFHVRREQAYYAEALARLALAYWQQSERTNASATAQQLEAILKTWQAPLLHGPLMSYAVALCTEDEALKNTARTLLKTRLAKLRETEARSAYRRQIRLWWADF